ncbi:MAG: major tail protein [Eubacteriales bacterium]|nr:major tail protein [Eubacteriales bacterium]
MENKYRYGVSRLAIAPVTVTDGVYSYGALVNWPGATALTLSPKGNVEPFEADNRDYVMIDKSEGYDGEVETAYVPAAIASAILALQEDGKKVAVEYAGQIYKQFALLAQFQGDAHNRRIALYDCVVTARPEIAAKTAKSKTPDTTKVKFAARPRESDDLVQMYTKSDTDPTVYSNWFTTVQEPVAGV